MSEDPLGFEWHEYIRALPKEDLLAQRGVLLKEDATLDGFAPDLTSDDAIRACCIDYMPFAWEKANGSRGISAWRSLAHYKAWLWMLGTDEFEGVEEYEHYGKEWLRRICVFLGLDADRWDDGVRVDSEDEE